MSNAKDNLSGSLLDPQDDLTILYNTDPKTPLEIREDDGTIRHTNVGEILAEQEKALGY